MVIGAELYPPGGLKPQDYAYAEEYYPNPHKSYAGKEYFYTKEDFYNTNTPPISMGPNPYIFTPQPAKHYLVGQEGYAYQDSSHGQNQKYKFHDHHGYGKCSNGMNHTDAYYSRPPIPYGHEGHGKGKHMNDMHPNPFNGSYESQHESYMHMGPKQYELESYDYYGESPYPANHEPRKHQKNWIATGAEWISKGC